MTQPNKNSRSMKMARIKNRRKLKARIKRQNAEKYTARTGKPAPA